MRSAIPIESTGTEGLFDETDWGVITLLGLCFGGALAVLSLPAVLELAVSGVVSEGAMLWPVFAMTGALIFSALQKCRWFPQDRRLILVASLLFLSAACIADVLSGGQIERFLSWGLVAVSSGGLRVSLPKLLNESVVPAQRRLAGVIAWGSGIASAVVVLVAGSGMVELLGQAAIWFGLSLFMGILGFVTALEIPAMAFESVVLPEARSPAWLTRELFWRLLLPVLSFRLIAWLYRRLSFEISRAGSPRLVTTGFSTVWCGGMRSPGNAAMVSAAIAFVMVVTWIRKSASARSAGASGNYLKDLCCRSGVCCSR